MNNHPENLLESIYFQEIDTRERIFSRLQLNFAVHASAITILAYMVRTIDYSSPCYAITLFYVGAFFASVFIGISIYISILALTGFEYKSFSSAKEFIHYTNQVHATKKELDEYNKKYKADIPAINPDTVVRDFIEKSLAECIDHNRSLNEYRKAAVRKSIFYIIISGGMLLFSSIIFIFFDLDASSPRKSILIEDRSVTQEISNLKKAVNQGHSDRLPLITQENRMNDENNTQNTPPPPPPTLPVEPTLQVSLESITNDLPDKKEIINEETKK